MEWTISFLSDKRIVVIETSGIASNANTLEMAKSISKAMIEYQTMLCLIDYSAISSVSGNIVDVYYRPQELRASNVPTTVKIAEVVSLEHSEHFAFLETVFRNRGFNFCTFGDRESAIQWLVN